MQSQTNKIFYFHNRHSVLVNNLHKKRFFQRSSNIDYNIGFLSKITHHTLRIKGGEK